MHRFVMRPHIEIPDEWEVLCLLDPGGLGGGGDYVPLPVVPAEPIACEDAFELQLGMVFSTSWESAWRRLTLLFCSRKSTTLYTINGYRESESYTVTHEESTIEPSITSSAMSGRAGRWKEYEISQSHLNPSNELMNGFYWYYNSCDITGHFHGSNEENQVFRSVGEGYRPCFFAQSLVPPQYSYEGDLPNTVFGWVRMTSYQFKALTLIADTDGLTRIFPPAILDGVVGGVVGGRGGVVGTGGNSTENNVVTSIRIQLPQNYGDNSL